MLSQHKTLKHDLDQLKGTFVCDSSCRGFESP